MHFKIDRLAKYPGLIPVLAKWHHRQWQHLNPESYDEQARREDYLRATADTTSLPQMLVAHINGHALGSARLIKNDMDTHPELTPWLASLYVPPDFRRHGVATRLITEIETMAKQFGFDQIYLFTEDKTAMYSKLGWSELFREKYYGEEVSVMTKSLLEGNP